MTITCPPPAPTDAGASPVAPPSGVRRLTLSPTPGLRDHLAAFGTMALPSSDGEHELFLSMLADAGLTGRGGAGFPAARKILAMRERRRGRAVVIGNGGEGEPLSRKDATLLRAAPHLVIDGLLLAGAVSEAADLVLHVRAEHAGRLREAIAERADAGGIRLDIAAPTFLSGEASAVVRALEGGTATPRDRTLPLAVAGFRGRPTLVQNVETLAQLALIARFGAAWFRSVGEAKDAGTRLVSVSDGRQEPAVLEVAAGTTLRTVLTAAGYDPTRVSGVLVGGFHGAWLRSDALGAPFSVDGLAPFGASPGAGVLRVLRDDECALAVTAGILSYLADQSAGQCGPCANGLPALAEAFDDIVNDTGPASRAGILAETVRGRGACHHPDGTARLALSALRAFDDEVHAHRNAGCTSRRDR